MNEKYEHLSEHFRKKGLDLSKFEDKINLEELVNELDIYEAELFAQNDELTTKDLENQLLIAELEHLFNEAPIVYLVLDEKFYISKYNYKASTYFHDQLRTFRKIYFPAFSNEKSTYLVSTWLKYKGYEEHPLEMNFLVNGKSEKFKVSASRIDSSFDSTYLISMISIQKEVDLINKFEKLYKHLQDFIDFQENIVILTDGEKLQFANKSFFKFLNLKELESFTGHNKCICELFIENDRYFHLGKVPKNLSWLEYIMTIDAQDRVVLLKDYCGKLHSFKVTLSDFNDISIVSFTDISENINEQIDLENEVINDELTNTYNRKYFDQNYKMIIKNHKENGFKTGIAMLDIDHFKDVNDTFGHDIGDKVLIQFVDTINKFSRSEDILVRWGGEEFILVVRISTSENLKKVLEHLRFMIEKQEFEKVGQKTCSIGGTIYVDEEDVSKTIKRADTLMYEAKNSGRNKICIG